MHYNFINHKCLIMVQKNKKSQNPALRKTAVSSRYGLVKMKHRDRNDRSIFRLWHLLNESEVGSSEYTLCGLATPDSNMTFEDCESEEYKRGGIITCTACLKMLNWCKSVE